jgi:hypothetical protein
VKTLPVEKKLGMTKIIIDSQTANAKLGSQNGNSREHLLRFILGPNLIYIFMINILFYLSISYIKIKY